MNLPNTRAEAKALGRKHYFTGKPCARGHVAPRFTSIGKCKLCAVEDSRNVYTHTTERRRAYSDLAGFITKASAVHGGAYTYEQAEYVNAHTKLRVTCPNHGMFSVTPTNHVQGKRCPVCAVQRGRAAQIGCGLIEELDRKRKPGKPQKLKALSFFSGAMGMDLGLEKAGIHLLLACEFDKTCRRTITANRPDIGLIGDIWKYDAAQIRDYAGLEPDDEIDIMVGGPPCQAFSTAGARRGFHDERGNAFLRYVDLILEMRPRFAIIENVRGLLSAPMTHTPHSERGSDWVPEPAERPGGALMHVLGMLRAGGYGVSFNLYNAANFGVPQSRERVIILCSRDGEKLPNLVPTHSRDGAFGLPKSRTLREALKGINPTAGDYEAFPEDRLRFYRMLGPGQYWKHLPKELHRDALGGALDAGGGKTGFLRRLDWDKPSCTLVTSPTMPATDICHPTENRPLSVQEYARVQQFPDDWIFCGSIADRYKQIGNAVPVGLGEAVGRAILAHIAGKDERPPAGFPFSRYKDTDEISWEVRTRAVMGIDGEPEEGPKVTPRTKFPLSANALTAVGVEHPPCAAEKYLIRSKRI